MIPSKIVLTIRNKLLREFNTRGLKASVQYDGNLFFVDIIDEKRGRDIAVDFNFQFTGGNREICYLQDLKGTINDKAFEFNGKIRVTKVYDDTIGWYYPAREVDEFTKIIVDFIKEKIN